MGEVAVCLRDKCSTTTVYLPRTQAEPRSPRFALRSPNHGWLNQSICWETWHRRCPQRLIRYVIYIYINRPGWPKLQCQRFYHTIMFYQNLHACCMLHVHYSLLVDYLKWIVYYDVLLKRSRNVRSFSRRRLLTGAIHCWMRTCRGLVISTPWGDRLFCFGVGSAQDTQSRALSMREPV